MIAITTRSSIRVNARLRRRRQACTPRSIRSNSADIGHPPDCPGAIVRDQERAVLGDRDAHRAAPDVSILRDESDQEILIFAGRLAVLHRDADHLVAGPPGAVPGTM